MVGPVKRLVRRPERFGLPAFGLAAIRVAARIHAPLSRRSFRLFSFALRLSFTPPSGELDEHAAARSFRRLINLIFACWLTHVLIRQGYLILQASVQLILNRAQWWLEGSPLTVQMPQPVRPTPRVNAHARTLKFATLRNDPSLHHQHLPRGCRPDEFNAFLYLNSFLPSRLRHRLALTTGARRWRRWEGTLLSSRS